MLQGNIRRYGVLLSVIPLLAVSLAQAQPSALDISLSAGGTSLGYWTPAIVDTAGSYSVGDVTYNTGPATLRLYNTTVSYDPFISASVDVINNTAGTQTYTLLFTLPISPAITGGTLMGGSVQGGLTDANGDGIGTLSTVGAAPLYYGQVDGLNVLPLFSSPMSMTVPYAFGSTSQSASAGLPGPTLPGPANAMTSIGILYQFSLTAGDRATFTGVFDLVPVPEPGSLSLLAIGGLMLVCRRR